jgi:hypothetical protein
MLWLLLLFVILVLVSGFDDEGMVQMSARFSQPFNEIYNKDSHQLKSLLFPNQSSSSLSYNFDRFRRKLQISKTPYTGSVPCTTCQGLQYCPILNTFMVQEVYFPSNTALRETCTVLDELGRRISSTIFGVGRTFRDTPQCRRKCPF